MDNDKYIKGFNDGYLLKKYKPKLIENIIETVSTNKYILGLKDGNLEYEKTRLKSRTRELKHLQTKKEKTRDKGFER